MKRFILSWALLILPIVGYSSKSFHADVNKIPFNKPSIKALKDNINNLKNCRSPCVAKQKKAFLMEKALTNSNGFPRIVLYGIDWRSSFELSNLTKPRYFTSIEYRKLNHSANFSIQFKKGYYFYNKPKAGYVAYWVDFANKYLGGGVFGNGFVQEEIMVTEMPVFAALLSANINQAKKVKFQTRRFSEKVYQGYPTPIIIKNLTRTLNINCARSLTKNESCYGRGIGNKNLSLRHGQSKIFNYSGQVVTKNNLQNVNQKGINIIAIAAPKLSPSRHLFKYQISTQTIEDLYNTAYAGFYIARQVTIKENKNYNKHQIAMINTGPLGAGAFNNHPSVVLLVQALAAQQLNMPITFYGYNNKKSQLKLLQLWNIFTNKVNRYNPSTPLEGLKILKNVIDDNKNLL